MASQPKIQIDQRTIDTLKLTVRHVRSREELTFLWWLRDLADIDVVRDVAYESHTYDITPKVTTPIVKGKKKFKTEHKNLFQPMTYTPDFRVHWNPHVRGIVFGELGDLHYGALPPFMSTKDGMAYTDFEVKPAFDKHRTNQQTTMRRKMVALHHSCFVQQVVVTPKKSKTKWAPQSALFLSTFIPERYVMTDGGGQQRKIEYEPKFASAQDWFESLPDRRQV